VRTGDWQVSRRMARRGGKFRYSPDPRPPTLKEESGKCQEVLKLRGPKSTKVISSDGCSEMSL
jgi:hypothetical protein